MKNNHEKAERAKFFEGFDTIFEDEFKVKFATPIRVIAEHVFDRQRFSRADFDLIRNIAAFCFSRERGTATHTGLVVAGFGEEEMFPQLRCFTIEAMIMGRLKYREDQAESISLKNPAAIRSFATKSVVDTIIKGVNPVLRREFLTGALRLVHSNTTNMIDAITQLTAAQKAQYKADLTVQAGEAWKDYFAEMDKYAKEEFEDPVKGSIAFLPKDELASVAESLVSLTSFRQRISADEETVGGPIDVAVISKGDGFIWIKRKHYFDIKFNPFFIEKYFRNP